MVSWKTAQASLLLMSSLIVTASVNAQDEEFNSDPWESVNRKIFNFNDGVARVILKPVAKGYKAITPDPLEKGLSNVFGNIEEVPNVINDLLQGKPGQALHDGGRFLINSTLGIAGLFDVAEKFGLEQSDGEDFGQTLAVWGVERGPYVVLPFLGPSSVRGVASFPVDSYTDPTSYIEHIPTRNTVKGVDLIVTRAEILELEKLLSGDKYTFLREAYLQRLEYLENDGEVTEDEFFDDFEDEDY